MTRRGYGTWPSPIDAEVVTAASRGYGALAADGDALYWIESRPEEGGRGHTHPPRGRQEHGTDARPLQSPQQRARVRRWCILRGQGHRLLRELRRPGHLRGDGGGSRRGAHHERRRPLRRSRRRGRCAFGRSRTAPRRRRRTGERPGQHRRRDRDGDRPARRPRFLRRATTRGRCAADRIPRLGPPEHALGRDAACRRRVRRERLARGNRRRGRCDGIDRAARLAWRTAVVRIRL